MLQFSGLIPSEPDERDYHSGDCVTGVGQIATPDSLSFPVYRIHDQGDVARCVGEDIPEWTEYNEAQYFGIKRGLEARHSAGFVYCNRFITSRGGSVNHTHQRKGMILEEALRSLLHDGVCLNNVWAYDGEYSSAIKITERAYEDARLRALDSYFRIYDGWDEIKETMNTLQRPLIASVPWYSYMSGKGPFRKPDPKKDTFLGYHAIMITGYTPDSFTSTVHYGPGWGDAGLAHYVKDFPLYRAFGLVDNNCPLSTKPEAKERGITVYYKDNKLFCAVSPLIVNNHILLPVRFIFETLGADVGWESISQTATGHKYLTTVIMQPGSKYAIVNKDGNAKQVELEAPATAISDRLYAPLRFVAEAFGNRCEWDNDYKEARIY